MVGRQGCPRSRGSRDIYRHTITSWRARRRSAATSRSTKRRVSRRVLAARAVQADAAADGEGAGPPGRARHRRRERHRARDRRALGRRGSARRRHRRRTARRAETVAREIVRQRAARARPSRCALDVTREADVERAFEATALEYGGVDIVVSNAGIAAVGADRALALRRLGAQPGRERHAATSWSPARRCGIMQAAGHRRQHRLHRVQERHRARQGLRRVQRSQGGRGAALPDRGDRGRRVGIRANMLNPDAIFGGSALFGAASAKSARRRTASRPTNWKTSTARVTSWASKCAPKTWPKRRPFPGLATAPQDHRGDARGGRRRARGILAITATGNGNVSARPVKSEPRAASRGVDGATAYAYIRPPTQAIPVRAVLNLTVLSVRGGSRAQSSMAGA